MAAADLTTRPSYRAFADRVNRLALPAAALSSGCGVFGRRSPAHERTFVRGMSGNGDAVLRCMGPVVAQNVHRSGDGRCPPSGVKRKCGSGAVTWAFDPLWDVTGLRSYKHFANHSCRFDQAVSLATLHSSLRDRDAMDFEKAAALATAWVDILCEGQARIVREATSKTIRLDIFLSIQRVPRYWQLFGTACWKCAHHSEQKYE